MHALRAGKDVRALDTEQQEAAEVSHFRARKRPCLALNPDASTVLLSVVVLCLQFYRVEVKVLPPDKNGAPRCRSVLRRFSHFKKLHGRVGTCSLAWHGPGTASAFCGCAMMFSVVPAKSPW